MEVTCVEDCSRAACCLIAEERPITAASAFSAQAKVGNVGLVRGWWYAGYQNSLCAFPDECVHNDVGDASSGAFNELLWLTIVLEWRSLLKLCGLVTKPMKRTLIPSGSSPITATTIALGEANLVIALALGAASAGAEVCYASARAGRVTAQTRFARWRPRTASAISSRSNGLPTISMAFTASPATSRKCS